MRWSKVRAKRPDLAPPAKSSDFGRGARQGPLLQHPVMKAPSRNASCRCGSGVKYKKCCLPKDEAARAAHDPPGRSIDQRGDRLAILGDPGPEALDLAVDYFDRNDAGEGYAAQLMRFSQPLIEAAGGDVEKVERAMTLGAILWNVAIAGEEADAMLDEVIEGLPMTEQDIAEFRVLVANMVERHVEMFPTLHPGRRERCAATKA
jgi:SEC-C motif